MRLRMGSYCDSFGFTPVPEFFLQREKQLTPRELLTGESIQTPRGSFLVTDMSREQLEAAGYGFRHQSEDGKYLIMGNGTDAFAIPAQQESPIKAAEMTTEQNYNMIDGMMNNAPSMEELEARAKAGEQISLLDVAEAAKAEAKKPKQTRKTTQKQKKPSIRAQLAAAKEELQPMKDIRYWVSKVLTPEQSEVEKKPEPKHSITEKMKFLQEQSSNQQEQKTPQQKKQNMEL